MALTSFIDEDTFPIQASVACLLVVRLFFAATVPHSGRAVEG